MSHTHVGNRGKAVQLLNKGASRSRPKATIVAMQPLAQAAQVQDPELSVQHLISTAHASQRPNHQLMPPPPVTGPAAATGTQGMGRASVTMRGGAGQAQFQLHR